MASHREVVPVEPGVWFPEKLHEFPPCCPHGSDSEILGNPGFTLGKFEAGAQRRHIALRRFFDWHQRKRVVVRYPERQLHLSVAETDPLHQVLKSEIGANVVENGIYI